MGHRPDVTRLGVVVFFGIFIALGSLASAADTCPPGWTLYDGDCYRVFLNPLPWEDAHDYCSNYGSNLATLPDSETTEKIGGFVYERNKKLFWTGLNRKDVTNSSSTEAAWADQTKVEDVDAVAVWAPDQPNYETYKCVMAKRLRENQWSLNYQFRMSFHPCKDMLPFVCMRSSCQEDEFFCGTGQCVSKNLTCNGVVECNDGSDEVDCPSQCNHYFNQSTGIITSDNYPSNYKNSTRCVYTIEGPPGSKVSLKFMDFVTEKDLDVVEILIGAKTEHNSVVLKTLSGNDVVMANDDFQPILSYNNFMIIKFSSDKTNEFKGFKAEFKTDFECNMVAVSGKTLEKKTVLTNHASTSYVDCGLMCRNNSECNAATFKPSQNNLGSCELYKNLAPLTEKKGSTTFVKSCPGEIGESDKPPLNPIIELTATISEMSLMSPLFPVGVPNMVMSWVIKGIPTQVITLNFVYLDLGDEDTITIHNGDNAKSDLLATLDKNSEPTTVISAAKDVYIYLDMAKEKYGGGFHATYKVGCNQELDDVLSGEVKSPGYPDIKYPNFVFCTTKIAIKDDQNFTFQCDDFSLADDLDILAVYNGENQQSPKLHTDNGFTGSVVPGPLHLGPDAFIRFRAGSTRNDKGFKCKFSVDCPPLHLNEHTNTSSTESNKYMASFSVSCLSGYQFNLEEYMNKSSVNVVCEKDGKWNIDLNRFPRCVPIRCGPLPVIKHGSPANLTDPNIANYKCDVGYSLSSNMSIKCQSNGKWEQPPTCLPAQCPALGDLDNGIKNVTGNETVFGAQVEFQCNPGYDLVGIPKLLCTSSGWSDPKPECRKLRCAMVEVENAVVNATGNYSEFGDVISISCKHGYHLNGSFTATCEANQTFTALPICEDVNECLNDSTCDQHCKNSDGSFQCSCDPGYNLNGTNCIDINECEGEHHCDEVCHNSAGSYSCSCNSTGHVLYAFDGMEGFNVPDSETGLLPGDKYYINHTCVPKQCPSTLDMKVGAVYQVVTNGQKVFHYGDNVTYMCNLGYINNASSSVITCQHDGNWSSQISCIAAQCDGVPPKPSEYTLSKTGLIGYKETLNITCSKDRPVPLIKTLTCGYDAMTDSYVLMGGTKDCVNTSLDCGMPSPSDYSGCVINSSLSSTTYLSTFSLAPEQRYNVVGQSQLLKNTTVTCMADGFWDYGDLQCIGEACKDPGTKPGTKQVATSYKPNNPVTYKCDRPGYVLSDSTPLSCYPSNATWNVDPPTCYDAEKPVWLHDYECGKTFYVTKFSTIEMSNFKLPQASDNTAVKEFKMEPTISMGEVIITDFSVQFTAIDWNNNTAMCNVTFKVKDETPPSLNCGNLLIMVNGSETKVDNASIKAVVNATDNTTPEDKIVITVDRSDVPASVNISNANMMYSAVVTARDDSDNEAQCRLDVLVKPKECTLPFLRSPRNGGKICQETATGYTCEMYCNKGFYFRDTVTAAQNITYTCNHAGSWSPPAADVPSCVPKSNPLFREVYKMRYNMTGNYNSSVCNWTSIFTSLGNSIVNGINTLCRPKVNGVVLISAAVNTNAGKVEVILTYEIQDETRMDDEYQYCSTFIKAQFQLISNAVSATYALHDPVTPDNCPGLVLLGQPFQEADNLIPDPLSNHFVCPDDTKLRVEQDTNQCLGCPPGTFLNSTGSCEKCAKGYYQTEGGQSSCLKCPNGTHTYDEGATDKTECKGTCAPGTISSNRLPPCSECPVGEYWMNDQQCTKCPSSPPSTTRQRGASNVSLCLGECDLGEFSFDGFLPCNKCPRGYYQSTVGQSQCIECSLKNQTTLKVGMTSQDNCTDVCSLSCGNGTCHILNHVSVCICSEGYTGSQCDKMIDFCESSPCYHNGTCTPLLNGFNCTCLPGASGDRCENDENNCVNHTCMNNGMCQDLPFQQYTCLCQDGYGGVNNKIERCNKTQEICTRPESQCQNGGTCTNDNNIHSRCVCAPGYTGLRCETDIDECEAKPCHNNGKCSQGVNSYNCSCQPGYSGENCEIMQDFCRGNPCGYGFICRNDYLKAQPLCYPRAVKQQPCPRNMFSAPGKSVCYTIGRSCPASLSQALISNKEQNMFIVQLFNIFGLNWLMPKYQRVSIQYSPGYTNWADSAEFNSSSLQCVVWTPSGWLNVTCNNDYKYLCSSPVLDLHPENYIRTGKDCSPSGKVLDGSHSLGDCLEACDYDKTCIGISYDQGTYQCHVLSRCTPTAGSALRTYLKSAVGLFNRHPGLQACAQQSFSYSVKSLAACAGDCWADVDCKGFFYKFLTAECSLTKQSMCTGKTPMDNVTYSYMKVAKTPDNYDDSDTDYCATNPCVNGTCHNDTFTYKCTCNPGYAGARCQHDIDDCKKNNDCQNEATCVDLPGTMGHKCQCSRGWNGTTCNHNIDDCARHNCSGRGLCVDLIDDFMCKCDGGFFGDKCQHEINECLAGPCLHQSQCEDLVNDFYCRCKQGWTGKRCELENATACQTNPCQNNGTCTPLFGSEFKCQCRPGTDGKLCGEKISVCANTRPCVHGRCSEKDEMTHCTCDQGYNGDNCETEIDYCRGCKLRNLECDRLNVAPHYVCKCPKGYEGQFCDQLIDYCKSSPCPGQGQNRSVCYNLIDGPLCFCKTNYEGPNCDKVPDTDFTLVFNSIDKTSYTRQNRPFLFGTSGLLSCSFVLRFSKKDGTGNILSLMESKENKRPTESGWTPFLTVDDTKIRINAPTVAAEIPFSSSAKINDGKWHVITFTWDLAGKSFVLYVDAVKISTTSLAKSWTLPKWGLTLFGAALGRRGDIIKGSSFQGYLSNFNVWNKVLSFQPDVVFLKNYPKNRTALNNIISGWLGLRPGPGCTRTPTSNVFGPLCDNLAYINPPACDKLAPDTTPPTLDFCPGDISLIQNKRLATHTWKKPKFSDYTTLFRSHVPGTSLFFRGKRKNVIKYTAEDDARNSKRCKFNLYLKGGCKGQLDGSGKCITLSSSPLTYKRAVEACQRELGSILYAPLGAWAAIFKTYVKTNYNGTLYLGASDEKEEGKFRRPDGEDFSEVVKNNTANENCVTMSTDDFGTYYAGSCDVKRHFLCQRIQNVGENCAEPKPPKHGRLECRPDGLGKKCRIVCDAGYRLPRRHAKYITCGPLGLWNGRKGRFRAPSCGRVQSYRRKYRVVIKYGFGTKCDDTMAANLRIYVIAVLRRLNSLWGNRLCRQIDCGDIVMELKCAKGYSRRFRRAFDDGTSTAEIGDADPMLNSTSGNETKSTEDILKETFVDNTTNLDFSANIAGASPTQVTVTSESDCTAGTVYETDACVECAPGTFYNNLTKICQDCDVGSYQNGSGAFSCHPCSTTTNMTTDGFGSTSQSDCYEVCSAGYYYSRTSEACKPCPVGYYQSLPGQFSCTPCAGDKTTSSTNSTSVNQCFDDCVSGTQLENDGSCSVCPIGTYRTRGVDLVCEPCGAGYITPNNGSKTSGDCTVRACEPGSYLHAANNTCLPCGIGEYQPERWKTSCLSCGGASYRTNSTGQTDKSACYFFCPDGEEVSGQENCTKCPVEKYRSNKEDGYMSKCQTCPSSNASVAMVSPTEGAKLASECTILDCTAGHEADDSNTECVKCPLGQYQPNPRQIDCISCGTGNSTRSNGTVYQSSCEAFCHPGYEKNSSGSCIPCSIGYYKANGDFKFDMCSLCPVDYITSSVASSNISDCNIRNCSAGTFRNSSNVCQQCPVGEYQDQKWQTNCTSCPVDKSTRDLGSASVSDCILHCPMGKEERDNSGNCTKCHRGYYKDNEGVDACTRCPVDFITMTTGAVNSTDCNVPNCTEGEYLHTGSNACEPCAKGTYQDTWWQTKCRPCGNHSLSGLPMTTFKNSSTSNNSCVLDCKSGYEFDAQTFTCKICAQAFFRDKNLDDKCMPCPGGNITETNGTASVAMCNLPNCTEGEYIDMVSYTCKPCPKGTYQDTWWQKQCKMCPQYNGKNQTTFVRGSKDTSNCVLDCPSGTEFNNVTWTCDTCKQAYYRDKTMEEMCKPCPGNNITESNGTVSRSLCNLPNCTEGEYIEMSTYTCQPCPKGTYQDTWWQKQCTSCPDHNGKKQTTFVNGSRDTSNCVLDCQSGYEYVAMPTKSCVICERGFYRNKTLEDSCMACNVSLITPTNGSTSVEQCSQGNCTAGYYASGKTCKPCEVGTYQPEKWQTSCKKCDSGYTTKAETQTNETSCIRDCPAGEQVNPNDATKCIKCDQGSYRNKTESWTCKQCPNDRTTPTNGSVSEADCLWAKCGPGEFINKTKDYNCTKCANGYYQNKPLQMECVQCPKDMDTLGKEGSTAQSDCKLNCPVGKEDRSGGNCTECQVGYYKSVVGGQPCTLCPLANITAGNGSTSISQCNVANCTVGEYLHTGSNSCQPCAKGTYQDTWWQTSCKPCPDSASGLKQTTFDEGSASSAACVLDCSSGTEFNGSVCIDCKRAYFRNKTEEPSCKPCANGFITPGEKANSVNECKIANCTEGEYLHTGSNTCQPCAEGTYQDTWWQTSCKPCPDSPSGHKQTTFVNGSTSTAKCVLDCPSGSEYVVGKTECQDCAQGYYRDKASEDSCLKCSKGITAGTRSTSSAACDLGNCTAGQKSVNVQCVNCPLGTYQPKPLQRDCESCKNGYTTRNHSQVSEDSCVRDCEAGYMVARKNKDLCEPCVQGFYRNKSQSLECELCPEGWITPGLGYKSVADCSWADCPAGTFIDSANNYNCTQCPNGKYQNLNRQTVCKSCPADHDTEGKLGSLSYEACVSTDECRSPDKNNCDRNAKCINTDQSFDCVCKVGYTGNGTTCAHLCDVSIQCSNGGTCVKSIQSPGFICKCTEDYTGDSCNRLAPVESQHGYIVGGSIGAGIFLIFLILLILLICYCLRKRQQRKILKDSFRNPAYLTPLPVVKSSSGVMVGQPTAGPTYRSTRSLYDNNSSSAYLFYEDRDEPLKPFEMTAMNNTFYSDPQRAVSARPQSRPTAYDEQVQSIDLQEEVEDTGNQQGMSQVYSNP